MPPIKMRATREWERKHQTGADGEESHSGASSNRPVHRAQAGAGQPSGRTVGTRGRTAHNYEAREMGKRGQKRGGQVSLTHLDSWARSDVSHRPMH
eukprot:9101653-Pyramimonas_sp.AAC.1